MSKIDLTPIGKTYNHLKIVSYKVYKLDNRTQTKWFLCKCICGVEKEIRASNVLSGSIKSCGCKRREAINAGIRKYNTKKFLYPSEKKIYSNYKVDSKRRNKQFILPFEDFLKIVNQNCTYCGSKPYIKVYNKTKTRFAVINGIDRIDSSIGYIPKNIVPCCKVCNMMKNNLKVNDFKSHVKKIVKFLTKK